MDSHLYNFQPWLAMKMYKAQNGVTTQSSNAIYSPCLCLESLQGGLRSLWDANTHTWPFRWGLELAYIRPYSTHPFHLKLKKKKANVIRDTRNCKKEMTKQIQASFQCGCGFGWDVTTRDFHFGEVLPSQIQIQLSSLTSFKIIFSYLTSLRRRQDWYFIEHLVMSQLSVA